jgi:hypothetical protein
MPRKPDPWFGWVDDTHDALRNALLITAGILTFQAILSDYNFWLGLVFGAVVVLYSIITVMTEINDVRDSKNFNGRMLAIFVLLLDLFLIFEV